jgi:hypothetical protein
VVGVFEQEHQAQVAPPIHVAGDLQGADAAAIGLLDDRLSAP